MDSPLVGLIREAQTEGVRDENWKIERIRGKITRFVSDSRGLLTRCGRVWVPVSGGVRQIVLGRLISLVFLSIQRPPRCIRI